MEHVSRKTELFIASYFEAIYFTEGEDIEAPFKWDSVAVRDIHRECLQFIDSMAYDEYCGGEIDNWTDEAVERAGIDFWLTRNNHGAGFWDGDWEDDIGIALTRLSNTFKEVWVYLGDDGKLYLT